jgi:hypothetical protein
MLAIGSLFEPELGLERERVSLGFWGEWEGPSVYWRIDSPGRPFPSIVHAPFRPAVPLEDAVQNTDPLVFGERFVYSNCMQATYRVLRTLRRGSIVLFGRYARVAGRPSFGLDTCFVVGWSGRMTPVPFDPAEYGADLIDDAVLRPLHTEGAREDLTVYLGLPRDEDPAAPFSFVPARAADESPPIFARPELRPVGALDGVVSPANMQGIKVTRDLSLRERDAVWNEVVQQVAASGCALGHRIEAPPRLEDRSARRLASGPPSVARPEPNRTPGAAPH